MSLWGSIRPDALAVLNDSRVRKALGRYLNVLEGKKTAKFLIARKIAADFAENDPLDRLWSLHEELTRKSVALEREVDCSHESLASFNDPRASYLDLKVCLANRIFESCHLCIRSCGINRASGERGWCKVGSGFPVSSAFQHMGEEPELVPSGTIFTVGCNLRCLHCQNWAISQGYEPGETFTSKMMADLIERMRMAGARNINMVGGDPTPWLNRWLESFCKVRNSIATIWNSNSYYSPETARLLAGFVDVYLLDFKYGNNVCAERISSAPKYWEACTQNHLNAKEYGEVIVRVLVLPGHSECCVRPILEWIAKSLGVYVRVNLMDQYRPEWRAPEIPELRLKLTTKEFSETLKIAKNVGLTNLVT
ncbi:MAG: putative pyruvate formate lyase activating enzyme [Thermoproteota archaeon]|nr:putative pyruvate formate lyase activating enzyme [Thermoproteota archaeon]